MLEKIVPVLLLFEEVEAPVQEPVESPREVEVVLEAIATPDGWVIDNFCCFAVLQAAEIEIVRPLARGEVRWTRTERCPYHGFSLARTASGSEVLVAERPVTATTAKKHDGFSRGRDPRRVSHGTQRI